MDEQPISSFEYPPDFIQPDSIEDVENLLKKLTFPDGFVCYIQSAPGEAALIYNEIVVKGEYFQKGVTIAAADCVIDVGANIGLFTMAVKRKAPDAVIYSIEAIPDTFRVLEQNVRSLRNSDTHIFNLALGSEDHTEKTFTFFPNMPGNSTTMPELKVEQKLVMDQYFGKEFSDYLNQTETRTVQVRTFSSFIREQGITRVDFLKIDVEGSEISVLEGIEEMDWSIIKQVVVETHSNQLRDQVCEILTKHGFDVNTDLGVSSPAGVSLVFARRAQN